MPPITADRAVRVQTVLSRADVLFAVQTVFMYRLRRRVVRMTTSEAKLESLMRAGAFAGLTSVNRYVKRRLIRQDLPTTDDAGRSGNAAMLSRFGNRSDGSRLSAADLLRVTEQARSERTRDDPSPQA